MEAVIEPLTHAELMRALQKIMWGKAFVDVVDGDDREHTIILRSLTCKESNLARYLHEKELKRARAEGLLSVSDLKAVYEAAGVWGPAQRERREILERGIKVLQAQIKDHQFFKSKKRKFERKLEEGRKELAELNRLEVELFYVSAEQRADEVERRFTVWMAAEDAEENRLWPTKTDFLNCEDTLFIFNLAFAYYDEHVLPEKHMRQLARLPEWRSKWYASKAGDGLFGRAIADWSWAQNTLVYWSTFYDNIFESMERPSDAIIENDEACDAWVRDQNKKHSSGSGKQDRNIFGNKKAATKKDHNEVFVMVGAGDTESIKEVQEMNTETVRAQLRREHEVIQKQGRVKEWDLRKGRYAK